MKKFIFNKYKGKADRLKNKEILISVIVFLLIVLTIFIYRSQIGNYINVGKTIFENNKACNEWSECNFIYNLDDYNNVISDGEQKRICLIGGIETVETKKCTSGKEIITRTTQEYIEIYDSNKNLISKIKLKKENQTDTSKLNIEIIP